MLDVCKTIAAGLFIYGHLFTTASDSYGRAIRMCYSLPHVPKKNPLPYQLMAGDSLNRWFELRLPVPRTRDPHRSIPIAIQGWTYRYAYEDGGILQTIPGGPNKLKIRPAWPGNLGINQVNIHISIKAAGC